MFLCRMHWEHASSMSLFADTKLGVRHHLSQLFPTALRNTPALVGGGNAFQTTHFDRRAKQLEAEFFEEATRRLV